MSAPTELRDAHAHVLVADLDQLRLSDDDVHHLARVLRLRAGELVTATNGSGAWRMCRFEASDSLAPESEVQVAVPPSPRVGVAFAITKRDHPELVVQKLTELGVDTIQPLVTERVVVRWESEKQLAAVRKWRKVAREALMQCRGIYLPEVADVKTLGEFVPSAITEPGGEPLSLRYPVVAVGPEGGWSEAEREMVAARVSLGPQILRSETAAIAAGAILTALRAGAVSEEKAL